MVLRLNTAGIDRDGIYLRSGGRLEDTELGYSQWAFQKVGKHAGKVFYRKWESVQVIKTVQLFLADRRQFGHVQLLGILRFNMGES